MQSPSGKHSKVLGALARYLAGAAVLLGGCGGGGTGSQNVSPQNLPIAVAAAQKSNAAVDPSIVSADNSFGLALLNTLVQEKPGNVSISPISVALALQIAYNGAQGNSQLEMAKVLQLQSLTTGQLNEANAALQASLLSADPKVTLTIANSLWMHLNTNPVLPSFTQMDQTYYGATVGDLAGAPDNVNAWVVKNTQGLITKVLPSGDYSKVVAVLANAVYFKGEWTTAFTPSATAPGNFTETDGSVVSVPMMHQSGTFDYYEGQNFQLLRLPYGQGRFSMIIVLPDPAANFPEFVAGLTNDALATWIGQLHSVSGSIAMPRFTSNFTVDLHDALSALGMEGTFCPYGDFGAIAEKACLSGVSHATVVQVDEAGTVAAGSTTATIGVTVVVGPIFSMTLDHPFVYAVRDDKTGELLFIGALENPT